MIRIWHGFDAVLPGLLGGLGYGIMIAYVRALYKHAPWRELLRR